MASILILGRDELKLVNYDPSSTVEQFRDQYFSSFEEYSAEGEPVQPRGHFKWNDTPLKFDLLMGNYPFIDEDILVFCEDPTSRLDIQLTVRGKARFYKLYFDDTTTVSDVKKDLTGKARLYDLPPERLILFTKEGIELSVGELRVREYGLSHLSLVRAKIMPEVIPSSLSHDVMTVRFNQQPLSAYENGLPIDNVEVIVTIREFEWVEEASKWVSVTCCEEQTPDLPISIATISTRCFSTEFTIASKLSSLKFDTPYCLIIHSGNPKYATGADTVRLPFSTRKQRGNVRVTWANVPLKWSESPLPDQIPIVHSLYHLLMKKVMMLGPLGDYESLLRRVRGFHVVYETSDEAITVNYNLREERQEELQYLHYVEGHDIHVEVIGAPVEPPVETLVVVAATPVVEDGSNGYRTPPRKSPSPIPCDGIAMERATTVAAVTEDDETVAVGFTAPQTPRPSISNDDERGSVTPSPPVILPEEQPSTLPVEDDVVNEAIIPANDPTVISTAVAKALALLDSNVSTEDADHDCVDACTSVKDVVFDHEQVCQGQEMIVTGESLVITSMECVTESATAHPADETATTCFGPNTDIDIAATAAALPNDEEKEEGDDDEVRSVHGSENVISPARQPSDGTESVVEYMDDGFLVLMTVNPMDESIMVADDN